LVLANDEAVRLLDLPSSALGQPISTLGLPLPLRELLLSARTTTDEIHLTGELNSVRGFAEALRSQAHEAANRLHTVITLVELGRAEQAVKFATAELVAAQELTDRLLTAVGEPVLSALLLGKAA